MGLFNRSSSSNNLRSSHAPTQVSSAAASHTQKQKEKEKDHPHPHSRFSSFLDNKHDPAAPSSVSVAATTSWLRSKFSRKHKESSRGLRPFASFEADTTATQGLRVGHKDSDSPLRQHLAEKSSQLQESSGVAPAASRHSTDFITLTLAQRLNELQAANSEGLLDDDEYRLLRQNLFDRFASSTIIPTEPTRVPVHPRGPSSTPSASASISRTTNASPLKPDNSSTRTANSLASQLHSLIRKGSLNLSLSLNKTVPPTPSSKSVYSIQETDDAHNIPNRRSSAYFPRSHSTNGHRLREKPSNNSLTSFVVVHAPTTPVSTVTNRHKAQQSNSQPGHLRTATRISDKDSDTRSLSSLRTTHTSHTAHTTHSHAPSSFHFKKGGKDLTSLRATEGIYDDPGSLNTVTAIKEEIVNVEKEMRGLMDAFGGLELSMMTTPVTSTNKVYNLPSAGGSQSSLDLPGRGSLHLPMSSRSRGGAGLPERKAIPPFPVGVKTNNGGGASIVTRLSLEQQHQSQIQRTKPSPTNTSVNSSLPSPPPSSTSTLPPSTPSSSPIPLPLLGSGSTLKRSGTQHSHRSDRPPLIIQSHSTPEESELSDIRRRRVEVAQRYEARLEFLRAKLKSVEMREKLSRR